MAVLVAYASRYGATAEIAERIAEGVARGGRDASVQRVDWAADPTSYEAAVVGSAVFHSHWMKEATEYVRRHRPALQNRPVWLFSSGPLGFDKTDDLGRDLVVLAEPKELPELRGLARPQGHKVFFGALDRERLKFSHRFIAMLPAGRVMLPDGDFRDWQDIENWACEIAGYLRQTGPPRH